MKKTLFFILLSVAILAVCVVAVAAAPEESAVKSPEKDTSSYDYSNEDPRDNGKELVLVTYENRFVLPDDQRIAMEDTYDDLVNKTNETGVQDVIEEVAKDIGKTPEDMQYEVIFNMHIDSTVPNEGAYNVTMNIGETKGFKALLCWNMTTGEWEIVDVEISDDKSQIFFRKKDFGTFVILSDNTVTGDHSAVALWAMLVSVSVFLLAVVLLRKRRA